MMAALNLIGQKGAVGTQRRQRGTVKPSKSRSGNARPIGQDETGAAQPYQLRMVA